VKNKALPFLFIILFFNILLSAEISRAQESDFKRTGKNKPDKETELNEAFARIDSLVSSRQFVFQSEFDQQSYLVFVLVDSLFGEVQNGNRNNLQGRITEYEVNKNEKKKTLSVTFKMRGEMYTADVFLFIGPSGNGKASIRSEFPGYFSFNGAVMDLEHASICEDPSHFLH
jgi:hypothetical protein